MCPSLSSIGLLLRSHKHQLINTKFHFSLGGNVALKYLGELEDEVKSRGIYGAAVACVPFDPVASHYKLDGIEFNRIVYSGNFLATLKAKVTFLEVMN